MKKQDPRITDVLCANTMLDKSNERVAVALTATANLLKAFSVPHYKLAQELGVTDRYFSELLAGKYPFPVTKVLPMFRATLDAISGPDARIEPNVRQLTCLRDMLSMWAAVGHAWKNQALPAVTQPATILMEDTEKPLSAKESEKVGAALTAFNKMTKAMKRHSVLGEVWTMFQAGLKRGMTENGLIDIAFVA